jgi:hypothetical protein
MPREKVKGGGDNGEKVDPSTKTEPLQAGGYDSSESCGYVYRDKRKNEKIPQTIDPEQKPSNQYSSHSQGKTSGIPSMSNVCAYNNPSKQNPDAPQGCPIPAEPYCPLRE